MTSVPAGGYHPRHMRGGDDVSGQNPYQLLGGEDGLRKLCAAFYRIMDESPLSSFMTACPVA